MSEEIKKIVKRAEDLQSKRGVWETHWEEIAERVWPSYSGLFVSRGAGVTAGEKRTDKMFDSTASTALTHFAAAMESMLTPRNSKWHRLRANNRELNKDRDVQIWFDDVTDILFRARYSPKANFASQQHSIYLFLGAFGTGSLFIDENPLGGIRYKAIHLGNNFVCENHQGVIDTNYRLFEYTARQAEQKWGAKALTPDMVKALENDPDKAFEFIHLVEPRKDFDPKKKGFKNMPFRSMYIAKKEKKLMSEGGYNVFPYATSRYTQTPGEIYGRSPAMIALPSIKTLNEQKKTVLIQGHRVTNPVLLAHDDGVVDGFSMKPGAINAGGMSADGRPLVGTLPTGNLAVGHQMMELERDVINDVFLVTLFQILTETPTMTATEVLERAQEKGALLSPTMGRQQSESLGPMIERELDILLRQGALPPMPQALLDAEGEYEVEYDSPLSRAQKAEEASGLFRTIEMATNYSNITGDLAPFDHIDIDTAMPDIMEINAVPARWRSSAEAIDEIRQGRAQQAEQQKMIEAAPAAAGLMKGNKDGG